jgi:hypothetical protein
MFVVKYKKINSTKIAENVYIRVVEIRDGCVALALDVPNGVPVKLEQTEHNKGAGLIVHVFVASAQTAGTQHFGSGL